jgi:hypothetical protein
LPLNTSSSNAIAGHSFLRAARKFGGILKA